MPAVAFFFIHSACLLMPTQPSLAVLLVLMAVLVWFVSPYSLWVVCAAVSTACMQVFWWSSVQDMCLNADAEALKPWVKKPLMPGYWRLCFSEPDQMYRLAGNLRSSWQTWLYAWQLHPLVLQFLVGSRELDAWHRELFVATGTMHLVAISGLHVEAIAYGLQRLLLVLGFNERHAAQGLVLMLLAVYGSMVGWGIPVQRAFIMKMLQILAKRRSLALHPWQSWQLALVLVLCCNWHAHEQLALYLSFGLVACLIMAPHERGWPLLSQATLQLGVLFVSCWFFGQWPWLSIFVNALMIPLYLLLVTLLLPVGFLAPWLSLAQALLLAISDGFYLLDELLASCASAGVLPLRAGVMLLLAPLVLFLLTRHCRHALAVLLMVLLLPTKSPLPGDFVWWAFPVGHGSMNLLVTHEHAILVDASAKARHVQRQLLPVLRAWQRPLDLVLISHPDADHREGVRLLQRLNPRLLYVGNYQDPLRLLTCVPGLFWVWDAVRFEIVAPERDLQNSNQASCQLLVSSSAGTELLLPGDATPVRAVVDLLASPHHGRQTHATESQLEVVSDL